MLMHDENVGLQDAVASKELHDRTITDVKPDIVEDPRRRELYLRLHGKDLLFQI